MNLSVSDRGEPAQAVPWPPLCPPGSVRPRCSPDVCSFSSTCGLLTFPLKSNPGLPFLPTSKWQMGLNHSIGFSVLHSSGAPGIPMHSHRSFPSLTLSHVYLLIRPSRRAGESRRKIMCPTLHSACSANPATSSLCLKMSNRLPSIQGDKNMHKTLPIKHQF